MSITLLVLLIVSIGTARFCPAQTAEQDTSFIMIRLPTQVTAAAIKRIADLGQAETRSLTVGTNVYNSVYLKCGTIDPTYIALLLLKNPGLSQLARLETDRQIVFPACARAPQRDNAIIGKAESIETIFRRMAVPVDAGVLRTQATKPAGMPPSIQILEAALKVVIAYTDISAQLDNLNQLGIAYYKAVNAELVIDLNNQHNKDSFPKGFNPNNLPANKKIIIPGAKPVWSSVQLRSDVKPADATRSIADALKYGDNPERVATVAPKASLIGPASGTLLNSQDTAKCSSSAAVSQWPLDVHSLIRVLARNRSLQTRQATSILILDNGFDFPDGERFPHDLGYIVPDKYIHKTRGLPDTKARLAEDIWGVNFAISANLPNTFDGDQDRWHGLGVANLALGGPQLEDLRHLIDVPIRLALGSVSTKAGGVVVIDPDAVAKAYEFARTYGIKIINASLEVFTSSDNLARAIKEHARNVLLVTAAGNDGGELGTGILKNRWPQLLGGDPRNAPGMIITVGALDIDKNGKGIRANFSRTGELFVDLLAPGCNMTTYERVWDDHDQKWVIKPTTVMGTSFAAPIVSFAAALLVSHGVNLWEVKNRLLTSVDVKPELHNQVFSSGELNVVKALSLSDDIIETYDSQGQPKFGRVVNKNEPFRVCGKNYLISDLLKLTVVRDKAGNNEGKAIMWVRGDKNQPEKPQIYRRCDIEKDDNLSLRFNESGASETLMIDLSMLWDFIPSHF